MVQNCQLYNKPGMDKKCLRTAIEKYVEDFVPLLTNFLCQKLVGMMSNDCAGYHIPAVADETER